MSYGDRNFTRKIGGEGVGGGGGGGGGGAGSNCTIRNENEM